MSHGYMSHGYMSPNRFGVVMQKKDNTDVWIFGGMPSLENTAEDDCLGMLGGGCRKYSLWWMVGIVRSRFTATHSPCEEQPCPGWCPVCLDIPSTTFVTGLKRKILNPKYFAVFMKSLFEKLLCWFSVKKSCTDKMVWAASARMWHYLKNKK